MSKSSLVDITMVLHFDSGKAVKVSDDGDEKRHVWLPHYAIEVHDTGKKEKGLPIVQIACPEKLALEKGLI